MSLGKGSKQVFYFNIISYLGFFIGTFSTIFIYPKDLALYGNLRYIVSMASTLMLFVLFGTPKTIIKFFPFYSKQNRQNQLLVFCLAFMLMNFILLLTFEFFAELVFYIFKTTQFYNYKIPIFILLFFISYSLLFSTYFTNYQKIAVPTILERVFPKIWLPVFFILILFWDKITSNQLWFFSFGYILTFLIYIFYLQKHHPISFKHSLILPELELKNFFNFSFFSFLGGVGSVLAFQIDIIMIREFIGDVETGLYGIAISMIGLAQIPLISFRKVASPLISRYLEENETKKLSDFYQNSSLALMIIAFVIVFGLIIGWDDLVNHIIQKKEMLRLKTVIFILGLNVIFDLTCGLNSEIIGLSKIYKKNILTVLILALINISLNAYFLMVLDLGLIGVAYATVVSWCLFNLIKMYLLKKYLDLFPFTKEHLYILLLFTLVGIVVFFIPSFEIPFLQSLIRILLIIIILISSYFINPFQEIYLKLLALLKK